MAYVQDYGLNGSRVWKIEISDFFRNCNELCRKRCNTIKVTVIL